MNWIELKSLEQLDALTQESNQQPVLIFKHSTTCSISATALNRLERNFKPEQLPHLRTYYLDLRNYRQISNEIAARFAVHHESPQAIVVKNGKAIYNASHFEIDYNSIEDVCKIESL